MKQESLFANNGENEPLANRVRPQNLDQFVGQEQLLGPGKILREIIDNNQSVSVVVNSNSNRQEDMRVVNFVKQFAKNPLIIDMKVFKLDKFDSDLQVFIEAYALNHYFDTLFNMYSIKTGRSAKTRRYYRLLEY